MASRIQEDINIDENHKLIIAVGYEPIVCEQYFHVFRNESDLKHWRNDACLIFTENRYFDHSAHSAILKKNELKKLNEYLKKEFNKSEISNWHYLVTLWNDNNPRSKIPDDLKMPDYDYKTIKKYKED